MLDAQVNPSSGPKPVWAQGSILKEERNLASTKEEEKNSICKDTASLKRACVCSGRRFWRQWGEVRIYREEHQGPSLQNRSGRTAGVQTSPCGQCGQLEIVSSDRSNKKPASLQKKLQIIKKADLKQTYIYYL